MTKENKEQLNAEITHIFDSGANHLRIFEMVENFIDKQYEPINSRNLKHTDIITFHQWKKSIVKHENNDGKYLIGNYDWRTNQELIEMYKSEVRLNPIKEVTSMHRENLLIALHLAIIAQEKRELEAGYFNDSALLGGWKENLKCLTNGGNLTFY